jgi:GT2 family glycosyltransferase
MIVTAVIVTYGERYHLLEQVVNALKKQVIDKIVVVLNGVTNNSKTKIINLASKEPILHILDLHKNKGSAGGFKNGILEAIKLDTDFLWLIDDDNCPKNGALTHLKFFLKENFFLIDKDALLSYRPDRQSYLKSKELGNGSGMLKGVNSALGFSIFSNNKQFSDYNTYGLKVAPYGGLFFHKDLIISIGLPDETYFLYGDDFDFSIRISKKGGKVSLVEESKLIDLEKSFHLRKKKFYYTRFHNTNNFQLIKYSVKNGIVFELNHQVRSLFIYFVNLFLYTFLVVSLLAISFNFKKIIYFLRGVFQGIKKGAK